MQPAAPVAAGLGRKLVLMSDLPALTHGAAAQGGARRGKYCLGGCRLWGGRSPWRKGLCGVRAKVR